MERSFDATRASWIAQNLFDANGNWSPGRHAILDGAWLPDGDIVTEFEARHITGIGRERRHRWQNYRSHFCV